jgi:general nucleoside transport system permease protein
MSTVVPPPPPNLAPLDLAPPPALRRFDPLAVTAHARPLGRAVFSVGLAFAVTAILILIAGKNPLLAYQQLLVGAFGSTDRLVAGLNKTTPYLLCAVGIALCFRGRVINIGAEGQIAVGGIAASAVALFGTALPGWLLPAVALLAGAAGGAAWAGIAAAIRVRRRVHEVLVTLLMNFIALLLVAEVLHGRMGEDGAGFPQSPLFDNAAWLPRLVPGTDLHVGIVLAVLAALAAHFVLWRTTLGFRWRVVGASLPAARYAGMSATRAIVGLMMTAGALAGAAGAIECLGVHLRLIEGFSTGFGFNAVAIALMGALNPLYVLPSALFFGFLETGAQAMQRQVGVPSSLVLVIQGLTMVFVLCAIGRSGGEKV